MYNLKCPSCKYQKRTIRTMVEDVVRYKSGKRKGQVKEIKDKTIEFYENDPKFHNLTQRGVEGLGIHDSYGFEPIDLYMCPHCGTVFSDFVNKGF